MRISLDEHGSKIWKVSRCRPIASNETILTTKQEFFFTKVALVQSMTDIKHVLLGFWLMMHSGMFISSYTTVYFFVNNFFFRMFIFQWIRYSKVLNCFLVEKLVRTQLGEWRTGSSKMCTGAHNGLMMSCFICRNLTFPLFKKGVFLIYGYFSPMRSISVLME